MPIISWHIMYYNLFSLFAVGRSADTSILDFRKDEVIFDTNSGFVADGCKQPFLGIRPHSVVGISFPRDDAEEVIIGRWAPRVTLIFEFHDSLISIGRICSSYVEKYQVGNCWLLMKPVQYGGRLRYSPMRKWSICSSALEPTHTYHSSQSRRP